LRFAIVGCGGIGCKRLRALSESDRLVIAADGVLSRAEDLARERPGARATADWRTAVAHPDVDVVVVATTNNWLAPITIAAAQAGKHVLVEKPAARSLKEIREVMASVEGLPSRIWVGFNHRYHPALEKARALIDSGELGPLMFIRGRYGHGGRLGYEREWRADPEISGGGELLDQGVHLIDLARWFLGDFTQVDGLARTFFWDMSGEDNAFLLLQTEHNQAAWLHASCTEWKNLFCFEIYGRKGKLQIDGLGGSYGTERLTYHRVLPKMGPPDTVAWEFPGTDLSFQHELQAFVHSTQNGGAMATSLRDAEAALVVVDTIYQNMRTSRPGFEMRATQEEDAASLFPGTGS
jgi:predicted dehydrogenase